jgi:Protein of unknown function (DUF2934)
METKNENHHEEIAHLAYAAWQRDGCPQGRDLNYWLEAETQLRATRHLLREEAKPAVVAESKPVAVNGNRRTVKNGRAKKSGTLSRSLA